MSAGGPMNRVGWVSLAMLLSWLAAPAWPAEDTFQQGITALQARDYDLALSCFNIVIQASPDLAPAYEGRGLAHAGKQAFDRAIADHTEAIRLSPRTAGTYYNRGNARLGLKEFDAAIADFTQAIAVNRGYAEAFNN